MKFNQTGSALIIGIIIAVVAVGGLGAAYYFTDGFGTNKSDSSQSKNSVGQKADDTTADKKSATGVDTMPLVKSALAGGGNLKCVSKIIINEKHVVSTMYINSKDRIFMNMRSDSGNLNTLFVDQAYSYTWKEGNDRGSKFTTSKDDNTIEQQWQENLDDLKNDHGAELSCTQVVLKDSMFVIPSNVTFSDASKYTD